MKGYTRTVSLFQVNWTTFARAGVARDALEADIDTCCATALASNVAISDRM